MMRSKQHVSRGYLTTPPVTRVSVAATLSQPPPP